MGFTDFDDFGGTDDFADMQNDFSDMGNDFASMNNDFASMGNDNSEDTDFSNNSSSSDSDDQDIDFGGAFNNLNDQSDDSDAFNNSDTDNRSSLLKQAVIIIIGGVVLLCIVGLLLKIYKSKVNKNDNTNINVEVTNDYNDTTSDINNTTSDINNTTSDNSNAINASQDNINSSESKNDWKNFSVAEKIDFSDDLIETTFTVTNIENYVKVSDQNDSIMVKTVATGTISGFIGTYELELPYDKGSLLKPGANLKVKVQAGKYNDNSVIGQIVII